MQEYDCTHCLTVHYGNQKIFKKHVTYKSGKGLKLHVHDWILVDGLWLNCWCGDYIEKKEGGDK